MRKYLLPVILLLALVSCHRGVQGGRDAIDYVKVIASETTAPEHVLLSAFSKVPSSGDIYILGGKEECKQICRSFLECDVYENARGREWGDGLKDFAGETFACIGDDLYYPYDAFAATCGTDTLREVAVRMALSTLSSNCSASIYDLDGKLGKTPAKLIILADPWLLEYGKFDIDTLFSLTSCRVPVLSPQDLLFDSAWGGEKKYFNTGVICSAKSIESGVIQSIIESKTAQHDILGVNCFPFAPEGKEDVLSKFLEAYLEAGNTEVLDAILIDDWSLDISSVEDELAVVRDISREEYMRYGKLLSPEFKVFRSSAITMSRCYELLRSRSLFTHRIAQPQFCNYSVKARPASPITQFLLIPSKNVQD